MYNYNPMQSRMEYLQNQKNMIDQQMASLQQYAVPPININNNIPQQNATNTYDFNGKWVSNEQEAKGVANNNLPLILFDANNPIFYMKTMDGAFKKFKFEEVNEVPQENAMQKQINDLQSQLKQVIGALTQSNVNTSEEPKHGLEEPKKGKGSK